MFTDFSDVIAYFDSFNLNTNHTGLIRDCRLERMESLLEALKHPEATFKTIHLSGSKGKGSTASYIAAGLAATGERVGLYLSPHLMDYRERFTLNGSFFKDDELLKAGEELKDCVDNFTLPSAFVITKPTPFELYTAYAYLLFKNAKVTWAVIETGLGGRLDATNTLSSTAEVILPIELEHTDILGDTIEKIALEKAKIIKPNTKVFVSYQKLGARAVIKTEIDEQAAEGFFMDEEVTYLQTQTTKKGEMVEARLKDGSEFKLCLKMRGEVQAQNAILSIILLKQLGFYQSGISERAIEEVQLPGRFEIIEYQGKTIVFDVAHTKESMSHCLSSFNELFPNKAKRAVIYGSIEGKDTIHMLQLILESFDDIIISKPGWFKKSNIDEIYKKASSLKKEQRLYLLEDSKAALSKGLELIDDEGALLVTGSFYLASAIEEVLK